MGLVVGTASFLRAAYTFMDERAYSDDQVGMSDYLEGLPDEGLDRVALDAENHLFYNDSYGARANSDDDGVLAIADSKKDSAAFYHFPRVRTSSFWVRHNNYVKCAKALVGGKYMSPAPSLEYNAFFWGIIAFCFLVLLVPIIVLAVLYAKEVRRPVAMPVALPVASLLTTPATPVGS